MEITFPFIIRDYRMTGNNNLERILPIYIKRFKQDIDEREEETGRDGKKESEIWEWLKRETQAVFSKENIDSPDKEKVIKILCELFATEEGGDDTHRDSPKNIKLAEKLYSQSFIDNLKDLLFGDDDISVRYQRFMEENEVTKSIASEFLTYFYPDKYAISNRFSESALAFLGFDYEEVPDGGKQIGDKYVEYCDKAAQVLKHLRKYPDFRDADFVTLDDFLYDISQVNIWKVAPGSGAHLWNEGYCQEKEIICIGWHDVTDKLKDGILTADYDTILKTCQSAYPDNTIQSAKTVVKQITDFIHEITT